MNERMDAVKEFEEALSKFNDSELLFLQSSILKEQVKRLKS